MSLEAIASSIPANSSSTPRIPIGNWPRTRMNEFPKTSPRNSFPNPRNTTERPVRAPKRYWPARPPAPWQTGIAPNQHPTKFINPTLTETLAADSSLSGNRSPESLQTAMTEFSTESGICGIAARRNPIFQSSQVIFSTWSMDGPRLMFLKIEGSRTKQIISPNTNTKSADGIDERILSLLSIRVLGCLASTSPSVSSVELEWVSPAPVERTRKITEVRAMIRPSRPSHEREEPDFDVAKSCSYRMYLMAEKANERP